MARRWLMAGALMLGIGQAFCAPEATPPEHLRDTGLYAPGSTSVVRAGNLPFTPQYPLWSDGTGKRRWLYLPPGDTREHRQRPIAVTA